MSNVMFVLNDFLHAMYNLVDKLLMVCFSNLNYVTIPPPQVVEYLERVTRGLNVKIMRC